MAISLMARHCLLLLQPRLHLLQVGSGLPVRLVGVTIRIEEKLMKTSLQLHSIQKRIFAKTHTLLRSQTLRFPNLVLK
jgi:hypothetical protein